MCNLSKEDIELIKSYEHRSQEGLFDDYVWVYNPVFDVYNMGNSIEWIFWLSGERRAFKEEFGYDLYEEIEKWWTKTPEKEPIIVIQQTDGEYSTWDGAHRVGISFLYSMQFVPAFIGTHKSLLVHKEAW